MSHLSEVEQRYRALVEQTPDAVLLHLDGTVVFANAAAARLLGADGPDRLVGLPVLELLDPSCRDAARSRVQVLLAGGTVPVLRETVRRLDGSTVAVDVSGSLVQVDGRATVQSVLHDASAEQAAVLRTEQQHQTLFERSPVGIVECDPDGVLVQVNEAFCVLLGRPAHELVGRPFRDLAAAAEGEPRFLDRLADGEDAPAAARSFQRPDGSEVHADLSTSVLRHPDGSVASIVATVVDQTAQRRATTLLEQLVAELNAAREVAEQRTTLLNGVLDTVDVGIVACDSDGSLTLFNRAAQRMHGCDVEPGLDSALRSARYSLRTEDGLLPLDGDEVPLRRALREGRVSDVYMTIERDGAAPLLVRCDGQALSAGDGQELGAVVAMADVTELRASEQRFRAAFHDGPTPMCRLDVEGTVLEANPALRRFLSVPTARLVGRRLSELVHPGDLGSLRRALAGTGALPVELRVLRADRTPVWCEIATTLGRDASGEAHVLAQLLDVDARRTNELALERAASQDPLTGLGNRSVLDRELAALLDPGSDAGAAVLFIDLDGFKAVNDTLGHDAGDAVLVELAGRLRAALRPGDTAARTGGDEFVVACALRGDDAQRSDAAVALRARVERALDEPFLHGGVPVHVSASVGSARSRRGEQAADLVARADQAMYARKAERRGRTSPVRSAAASPSEPAHRSGQRLGDESIRELLRSAVAQDRLRLHYQPVVLAATGQVVGTEALLRLVDDAGQLLSPDRFIPVAEAAGTISELGRWALREALTQTHAWKQLLAPGREFGIGVNLSPQQLFDPDLVPAVEQALQDSGIDPGAVVLEITEGRLLSDSAAVREITRGLVDLGVHLAVDDFGTGFAGAAYLTAFPFDTLKLDRRYTASLTADSADGRLARGLFSLAAHTGLTTIAEGVETPQQAEAVLAAGTSLAQGYLWHRPLEPAALAAVLRDPAAGVPPPRREDSAPHRG